MKTAKITKFKKGDIVKPTFRGEDQNGKIIDWTYARFRVEDYPASRGEDYIYLTAINDCARELGNGDYHKESICIA